MKSTSKIRKIEFPRIVIIAENSIDTVAETVETLSSGKNVLLVADKGTFEIAGSHCKDILESKSYTVAVCLSKRADMPSIEKCQSEIKQGKAGIVIGVGGGTVIDIAKLSSSREKIPFISIPTVASHDGISSPIASIKVENGLKSEPANAPIAIIADTSIIAKAPHRFMASGCADLISNYTSVEDWKLANRLRGEHFGHYAAALSIMSAEVMMEQAKALHESTPESAKIVMEGLISSGAAMCIAGSSRPCSGAEHLFSHALDKISPVHAMHGEQCGVGTIIMAYLHKLDWQKFRNSLDYIGAPTTAKQLGIKKEHIVQALTMSHTIRDRFTILGKEGLTEEAALEVAEKTEVI